MEIFQCWVGGRNDDTYCARPELFDSFEITVFEPQLFKLLDAGGNEGARFGLPFLSSYNFVTAAGSVARATIPYTVSVGIMPTAPFFINLIVTSLIPLIIQRLSIPAGPGG